MNFLQGNLTSYLVTNKNANTLRADKFLQYYRTFISFIDMFILKSKVYKKRKKEMLHRGLCRINLLQLNGFHATMITKQCLMNKKIYISYASVHKHILKVVSKLHLKNEDELTCLR